MANSRDRIATLRARADFLSLTQSRDKMNLKPWLMAKVLKNPNELRVGWTLPKATGTAVVRNRLRRWVRVYLDNNRDGLLGLKFDVNLIFRKPRIGSLKDLKHEELDLELDKLFKRLSERKS